MQPAEHIDSCALERHQAEHERDRRIEHGLQRCASATGGVRGGRGHRVGRFGCGKLLGTDGLGAATGRESEKHKGALLDHVVPCRAKAPRWGPVNSVDTSRRNAMVSRVSSGVRIASTKPRAPAKRASSWCSQSARMASTAAVFSGLAASLPYTAWTADSPSMTPMRPVGQETMKSGSKPCPAI